MLSLAISNWQGTDGCVVEFRRTSGSCIQFHEVYKKLSAAMSDHMWTEDATDEEQVGGSGEELISDEAMMI